MTGIVNIFFRRMVEFGESYMRSVASKTTADFKGTAESQTDKFTQFEVSYAALQQS